MIKQIRRTSEIHYQQMLKRRRENLCNALSRLDSKPAIKNTKNIYATFLITVQGLYAMQIEPQAWNIKSIFSLYDH